MEHNHPFTIEAEREVAALLPGGKEQEVSGGKPAEDSVDNIDLSYEEITVPFLDEKQGQKGKTKKRSKLIYLLLCILLVFGTIGSIVSTIGYQTYQAYNTDYHQYLSLAQEGIQHLQTAEKLLAAYPHNPFDPLSVIQAQDEFDTALDNFNSLDNDLKPLSVISKYIPEYGIKLHAALDLIPMAIEASQAGVIGCNMLYLFISKFRDLMSSNGHSLSSADITTISDDLEQIEAIFYQVVDQINHLPPAAAQLDPRVSKLVSAFHNYLPMILSAFDDAHKLLTVVPTLLGIGKPTNYLIEVLDSTELRPGGGFIGNYGILTLANGREADAYITDVDLLDRPFEAAGHILPFPSAYNWFDLAPSWSLRDTNLDADFPTVARYSEQNYKLEGGRVSFQGVIAITPVLIQHVMEITGPIYIPEYHETVTAQNLITRIHYHQLVASEGVDTIAAADGHSSQRKRFTALLAEHFLARIRQLAPSAMPQLAQIMMASLRSKDLQIYLNSSIAEGFLQHYHLDAAVQSPGGDSLFVVNANIGGNKANPYIKDTLNDQVAIDGQGNAVHHTTITYAWTIPGPIYGLSVYRDYMRVYVPPGSILHTQAGWEPRGTSKAFGRTIWAGYFTLTYGHAKTITLNWRVPKAASKDVHGWHYQYLLQRQAGTLWTINLHMTLPSCAVVTHTSGELAYHNKLLTVPIHSLSEDTNMGIDYTC